MSNRAEDSGEGEGSEGQRRRPGRDRASAIVVLLLVVAAIGVASQRLWYVVVNPTGPLLGTIAPDLSGRSLLGHADLSQLRGRVVLVDFWATWCPPCVASIPTLSKVSRTYEAQGLTVLGVNQDHQDEDLVRRFSLAREIPFDSILDDGSLAERFGVLAFPSSFLIDREGRVVQSYRGPARESRLRHDIEEALAQAPKPTPTTAPSSYDGGSLEIDGAVSVPSGASGGGVDAGT